jgi:4a-hydroxytetrahydrobiopterin dehydratase
MDHTPITADEWAAVSELADWRFAGDHVQAAYRAPSFTDAGQLAAAIARAADEADHHPDLDLRYPGVVGVTLSTHSAGGVTRADLDLARRIVELAAERAATIEPGA